MDERFFELRALARKYKTNFIFLVPEIKVLPSNLEKVKHKNDLIIVYPNIEKNLIKPKTKQAQGKVNF